MPLSLNVEIVTEEKNIYSGPTGLPSDLGEREMLLINAMESAMEENLSNEYEKLIQLYFLNLQKFHCRILCFDQYKQP